MSELIFNLKHGGGNHRVEIENQGDTTVVRFGASFTLRLDEENLNNLQAVSQQLTVMNQLLPRLEQQLEAHDKRISSNEEWVDSINSFRRQVNRQLNTLSQPVNKVPELQ